MWQVEGGEEQKTGCKELDPAARGAHCSANTQQGAAQQKGGPI